MPSTCVFEFDRPQPVYYSGETINGRILLHTTSEKNIREAYILFEGEAKVRWEESRSRSHDGKTEHYTEYFRATETYLNTRTSVHGDGTLQPGTYTYTFCIPLPLQCPTSCVEKYGKIAYELALVLNRPYRFDNIFKQPLTVLHQVNLNMQPELLIPLKSEDIKYFCCWPCSSGPVVSTLIIPFGGYAPGQKIKYNLQIDNQSTGYDLEDGLEIKLKQVYKFVAHTPHHKTRYHTNTLALAEQGMNCLRLSKRIIEGELVIPPVPPTSDTDYIIGVRYEIKMSINTGCCHTDSELVIPITIGTVPLAQSATNPQNAIDMLPTAPGAPDTPFDSDAPPNYEKFKPPSFEDATTISGKFIDQDVDERNRTDEFIPKYPMYNNFAVPTAPVVAQADTPLLQSQAGYATNSATPETQQPLPTTRATTGYGWNS
ncbi:arrestin domain-containing protein 3-like [Anastrepha obliqua]|uniref:arrestin domain-containing protein 3-like n=1 Tax=Anastrepha obliqua TaxID=95512 RepID=UPI00240A4D1D|nr:arrestin domain-containing protein 3-like [Anastrepha obliqua]XP_054741398.1 arrestin domain-containing protein 3-like [Anastrepha obliqua]XP_054741406.1 arrestin domain-containing protein 3-like [Anastrepha obliqua]